MDDSLDGPDGHAIVPPSRKTPRVYSGSQISPRNQIDNLSSLRVAIASSNSVLEANVGVNRFDASPIERVTAKPLIGPVPNWNRKAAAINAATCVSNNVRKTRL